MTYPVKYQKIVKQNINEIGKMIGDGKDIKEISETLNIKYHSLRSYLKSLDFNLPSKKAPNKGDSIHNNELTYLDKVNELLDEGESLSYVCKELDLSYGFIYDKVKHRLSMNKTDKIKQQISKTKRTYDDDTEKLIIEDYMNGNSMYTLAKSYSIKPGVIYGILKRNNVKMNNQSLYWDEERRELQRKKSHNGEIGFHDQGDVSYRYTKPERDFASWCESNDIEYERQFQIKKSTHRYDFILKGTTTLVEIDGEFWHNTKEQSQKDRSFEEFARENGYDVVRFTDREMYETRLKCFEVLL